MADIWWNCSLQLSPAWHLLALKFISRHWDICVRHASHIKDIFANYEEVAGDTVTATAGWRGSERRDRRGTHLASRHHILPSCDPPGQAERQPLTRSQTDILTSLINCSTCCGNRPLRQKRPLLRPVWSTFSKDNNSILTWGLCVA